MVLDGLTKYLNALREYAIDQTTKNARARVCVCVCVCVCVYACMCVCVYASSPIFVPISRMMGTTRVDACKTKRSWTIFPRKQRRTKANYLFRAARRRRDEKRRSRSEIDNTVNSIVEEQGGTKDKTKRRVRPRGSREYWTTDRSINKKKKKKEKKLKEKIKKKKR